MALQTSGGGREYLAAMKRTDLASVWQKRLEAFERSGLTVKQYCEAEGVGVSSFFKWRGRLAGDEVRPQVEFVEVGVGSSSSATLEVIMTSGIVVRLDRRLRGEGAFTFTRRARSPLMFPASIRIFVCTAPQDMRRSFDGLALAVQERLGGDPQSGALFVFINKRANRLKALWFDRNGYCIIYKRLHQAVFVPPRRTEDDHPVARVDARRLAKIFAGVEQKPRARYVGLST